jgi:iron(III) transport system permease protein
MSIAETWLRTRRVPPRTPEREVTITKDRAASQARVRAPRRIATDTRWTRITFWVVLAVLTVVIVAPLIQIMWTSLRSSATDDGFDGFARWVHTLTDPANVAAIKNTVLLVATSTVIGGAIGFFLAVVVARTDIPGGRWFGEFLPVMSFLFPPLLGAFGWMFLGSPQAGLLNAALRLIPGVPKDAVWINIYSVPGIIAVGSIYVVPFAYLYLLPALVQVDSELEEAAMVSGSSSIGALLRITVPVIRPAILSTTVVVVMVGLAEFSIPLVLGTSLGFEVISLRIWEYSSAVFPPQPERAAVLGTVLLLPALIGLYLQRRLTRDRGRYEVMAGRGRAFQRVRLGRWTTPIVAAVWLYISVAVLLPAGATILVAFERFWTADLGQAGLSLTNVANALKDSYGRSALWSSLQVSVVGATIATALALTIVILTSRTRIRGRSVLEYIALIPLGVPSIVYGLGFVVIVFLVAGSLYGTPALLLIGYVVVFLPLAVQVLAGGAYQISRELGEASRVSGATLFHSVRLITVPLLMRFLVSAWLIQFVSMFRELPVTLILAPTGSSFTSLYLVSQWQNALYPVVAAFGLLILLINAAVVGVLWLIQRGTAKRSGR